MKGKADDGDNGLDDEDNDSKGEESAKQPAINQGAHLGYTRCYVEDFTTTAVGDCLIILIPEGYSTPIKIDHIASSWTIFIKCNLQRSEHKFTDGVYLGLRWWLRRMSIKTK